ncbi:MAG: hypothetical protein KUA43_08990 [Hoeflea sp.]|uniref:hypothetical protein n=1 Tax=Hoeflea sp. TaxID=1940281 RepID=UPI001D91C133|nr:hypothetical protein [Hoeflea sp.]MBU4528309.1 hypothetical protein [Alphaproteobacteria bacterium]MBU4542978.1 hypothetical protein [Alphaproteobacteria bacterium]MBU4551669.1 hypothetical protein [Alphaproteobacteria bacterium]MBV1723564.1 hypothetical protein [Hoeflea sp.]MBV1761880.1 hypothetical protein [Hoeflea sp.]
MTTLARRFIIICLIFVIFALLMAAAVAKGGHQSRGWHNGAIDACVFLPELTCSVRR